ncbi:MAG: pilus assembly protein PilP [Deltaproteobacteria bacterium]|nr:pilus assembly protein PilP [Deltaproteobacteria bacterium]
MEANQRKEELLNELRSWRESVNRDYAFTGATISDPFMPVESVAQPKPPTVAGEEELRAKPMIQKLALNQFTLVAIVVGKNGENNLAMVDSGGKGYIVKKGDLIGNNKGYVKEITQNKLIVEEPEIISRASKSPRITEFRLNALGDNDGEITLSSYGE